MSQSMTSQEVETEFNITETNESNIELNSVSSTTDDLLLKTESNIKFN